MGLLILPDGREVHFKGDTSGVSDGYNSIAELYGHRCILFMCLANQNSDVSWKTRSDGFFLAGMDLPVGCVTYHIPDDLWDKFHVTELEEPPTHDGHTPDDVIKRLHLWAGKFVESDREGAAE